MRRTQNKTMKKIPNTRKGNSTRKRVGAIRAGSDSSPVTETRNGRIGRLGAFSRSVRLSKGKGTGEGSPSGQPHRLSFCYVPGPVHPVPFEQAENLDSAHIAKAARSEVSRGL